MSDTAAFFASKKKKKAFKFNANVIDVTQVTSSIHIDAPPLSNDAETPNLSSLAISKKVGDASGDWDENALASKVAKTTATSFTSGYVPSELMDMKALELKMNDQDDIAERMRIEETRKKLAAAREGMEKEAQRLREEKEAKEAKKREQMESQSKRFGGAAAEGGVGTVGGVGKWVPSRIRESATVAPGFSASRFQAAASATGYQRKVDINDEELFPDLATAGKLIQEAEEQKAANAAAAAAANKAKAAASKPKQDTNDEAAEKEEVKEEEEKVKETKVGMESVEAEVKAEVTTSTPISSTPGATVPKKKKKKKDLSTFMPA
mmetsp:Transcript_17124/g.32396  ORF Transcript_17124/g.32396 Transcript_17124/m.32396 type:complete len:322 (+) Transcript_17124:111-1076(+)|eukprot:CAMPEP_0176498086 /NCGR_PEP_ID=MMETSP0200_2-20121128/12111_1 /TAXON_ID=947934 /ORGANISM="Chaetoceros sp., Strain GSL56" /LENGTH=321 /DNA_ID=CAMNT_0017896225 /DNA_START=87 /DNA_END=1052 /DNA_ORIENTATION=-